MAKKEEKSIPITSSTDKRQITGTFAISLCGNFLPMQLIYQGKTDRCHPNYTFPKEFHITHTENHWSIEEKCKEFVLKILMPYVEKIREELQLRKNQEWLLLADFFKGQWTEEEKQLVHKINGKMVPVPNNMIHIYQPLDLAVNRSCKAFLRKESQKWFVGQVQQQIQNGCEAEQVKVDLRISILKPIQAQWLTSFYDRMQNRPDIAVKGFKRAGITNFLATERQYEDPFL